MKNKNKLFQILQGRYGIIIALMALALNLGVLFLLLLAVFAIKLAPTWPLRNNAIAAVLVETVIIIFGILFMRDILKDIARKLK